MLFFKNRTKPQPPAKPSSTAAQEIRTLLLEMEAVRTQFDMTDDSDLIDSCIHRLCALEGRYRYLLRCCREGQGCAKTL